MKVYTANRRDTDTAVYVNGSLLYLEPSQALYDHGADSFEWSYGGQGPSQLALAILLDYTDDPELSMKHSQQFKWDFIAVAPFEGFVITSMDVDAWIRSQP